MWQSGTLGLVVRRRGASFRYIGSPMAVLAMAVWAMAIGCSDDGVDETPSNTNGGASGGIAGATGKSLGGSTSSTSKGTGGSGAASGAATASAGIANGSQAGATSSVGSNTGNAGGGARTTGGTTGGGIAGTVATGALVSGGASSSQAGAGATSAGGVSNAPGGTSSAGHAGSAIAGSPNGSLASTGGASTGGTSTGGANAAGNPGGSTVASAGTAGTRVAGTAGVAAVAGAAGMVNPPTCGAELRQPVTLLGGRLVIMLDKSASMGADPYGTWDNGATRWTPVSQGLLDFFTNGNRAAQASLEIFPAAGDKTTTCQADYKTPLVAMRPLPDAATFASVLGAINPAGGTPMLSAVMGAIAYAKSLEAAEPLANAVVVLITDGEPAIYNGTTGMIETDCAPVGSTLTNTIGDIESVTGAAYSGTPSIPTYVIGVGEALTDLSGIASSGGTSMLYASNSDPAQARLTVSNALVAIATNLASCSIAYPAIPQGVAVDSNAVNVELVNGTTTYHLSRTTSCSGGGWHYDNAASPKRIVLCPATCQSVLAGSSVSLVLGCDTRVFD